MRTIRITGTGSALPGRIVTNKELEQMVETSDEWIRERTGIGERHVSVGETVVTLASEAARKALEQAGKRAEEIDLILVATCSPEQYLPCCACQVQADIGAVNALAFDVNAACSGFLFALNTADAYLRTGLAENALVIGSVRSVRGQFDLLSKIFTLRPSTISFNGGAVSNPLLDVTLRYEVPDITADVRVSGSVRRMKLELTSTPSLPQEEIISRVMFGRGSSELGRFESLRLAAAVARLAGFGSGGLGVLDLGRAVLGVDVLRVNSATDKESGDEESSLEVGKFIGEKIYLGVEQGLEPDSTAVIMELELTPHSKAGIRTEQDNTSAGVQWKMNY